MNKGLKANPKRGEHDRENKPTTQKNQQKINSKKIVDIMKTFSASKPTNVDAQRIICVLDALIEKVAILQYLDTDLFNTLNDKARLGDKEELFNQISETTKKALLREADLESKLKPLLGAQENNIDKTNDESSPTIDFAGLVATTAKNCRNLIRDVQNNYNDFELVRKLRKSNNPAEDYEDFLTYLSGLKTLMLKRLSTSVEEQASHDRMKDELEGKIKLWERTKDNKDKELKNLKKDKEKYITEKDEELNKLKNQIDEIANNKEKKMKELDLESKRDQETMRKNFEEKEAALKKQLQGLQDDLKEVRAKNKTEETRLRDTKTKVEERVKEAIETYDEMMSTKETEITGLETELIEIERQIKETQSDLTILKNEEEKEKEIAKKIAKKKELHETEKDRINNIVQAIQNAWKFYKVKAKPGKKKKGKGKGKDGKKK